MSRSPIYKEVILNNLCIGCGACAAICPKNRLSMKWNEKGYYGVVEDDQSCAKGCNICIKTCPFADGNPDENELSRELFGQISDIKHREETGHFQNTYVGYSLKGRQRLEGASGGMATWFLTELLRNKVVDKVVCVGHDRSPRPLFKYSICDTEQEVQHNSKSGYYPVEMSAVLKEILSIEGRYAIVCLPCYAKAVRLAMKAHKKLAKRIVCVLGLVCGQGVNKFFAEYTTEKAGGIGNTIDRILFRIKDPERPASDFGTDCFWKNPAGVEEKVRAYWSQEIGRTWVGFWFVPNPCLYCDDIFAETADVVFMDAWLNEYIKDFRGTNLVAIRSNIAAETCREKSIHIEHCPVEKLIESQEWVVANKREGVAHRLWLAQSKQVTTPRKRVSPRKAERFLKRLIYGNQMRASATGPSLWKTRSSVNSFEAQIRKFNQTERMFKKAVYYSSFAYRVPRKLGRVAAKIFQ